MTTSDLAKRTGASEPTIRKKLARMMDSGMLRVRAVATPSDLGYGSSAYIGLDIDKPRIKEVAEALAAFPFIDSVTVTTGPYDIIVRACFETIQDLSDFVLGQLGAVEGVKDSHSFLFLEEYKSCGLIGVAGQPAED